MYKDYKIALVDGVATMTMTYDDSRAANVLLSMLVEKGTFFAAPSFGLPKMSGTKLTNESVGLIRGSVKSAVGWIKSSGRAREIVVNAERSGDMSRISAQVEVVWRNNQREQYQTFLGAV